MFSCIKHVGKSGERAVEISRRGGRGWEDGGRYGYHLHDPLQGSPATGGGIRW